MRVSWDAASCMLTGACEAHCPEVFSLQADKIVIRDPEPDPSLHEKVQATVDLCPTGALTIDG